MSANFTVDVNVKIQAPELTEMLKQFLNALTPMAIKEVEPHIVAPQAMKPQAPAQKPAIASVQNIQQGQAVPIATPAIPPTPTAPVAAAPTYNNDDLARAASQLMDAGKQKQLIDLLGTFGVQALTQLPKDKYGEFATALRQLGAKI